MIPSIKNIFSEISEKNVVKKRGKQQNRCSLKNASRNQRRT
jgi:hypothetical protein